MPDTVNRQTVLEQLRDMTVVVADTGDIGAISRLKPVDATTNPSLILKAAQMEEYQPLVEQAISKVDRAGRSDADIIADVIDHISVVIGGEILKTIPGRVSVEVDARLSFDTDKSVNKAHKLIDLFDKIGVGKDRVLIKLAATWEGIKAAEILEKEGINCNLTLIFNFAQARASAEAGGFLISPFVGRILDWYTKNNPDTEYTAETDPGVVSVTKIYNYFKSRGFETVVMGASFRNVGEIKELAGCDRLTIGPNFLDDMSDEIAELPIKLSDSGVKTERDAALTEEEFRWEMNADPMATEKLAEGIRGFYAAQGELENIVRRKL
jgi:transaldolase